MMLRAAGAAVLSLPSNEIYAPMQAGACDAVITSSASLIPFRLGEVSRRRPRGAAGPWYMLVPLLMSKTIFDGLLRPSRISSWPLGADLERSARAARKPATSQSPVLRKGRREDLRPRCGHRRENGVMSPATPREEARRPGGDIG